MENLESLLSSPQLFKEYETIEELFTIASEFAEYGEVWSSVEEVTPALYELTLTRLEYANDVIGTSVAMPVFEAYTGDTKADAVAITMEGIGSVIAGVLAAIRKFIKWVLGGIFSGHKKYRRNKSVLKDVEAADSDDINKVLEQIINSGIDDLEIKVIGGKAMVANLQSQPKDIKTIIKLMNNIGTTLLRFMGPHPRLNPTTNNFNTLVSDYATMISEHVKYIREVTDLALEATDAVMHLVDSGDHTQYYQGLKTATDNINKIGKIVNTDNVELPKADLALPPQMVSTTTSRYGVHPGSQTEAGYYYSSKLAHVISSLPSQTRYPMDSTVPTYNNLLIVDHVVEIDATKNTRYNAFTKSVESGTKGIAKIVKDMMSTPVRDFKKVNKLLDELDKESVRAGKLIQAKVKEVDKHLAKKQKDLEMGKLTQADIGVYKYMLGMVKLLTYWYASKMGSVRVIENKAEGLVIEWIV